MTHEVPAAELQAVAPLETGFDLWQQRLERLEAETSNLAGTGQYPEWFNREGIAPIRSIKPQIQSGEADASYISRYFDLRDKELELDYTITGREPYVRTLQGMVYDLGEDVVGRGFAAESSNGSLHTAMLADIEKAGNTNTFNTLTPELNALKVAYGTNSLTDLLGVGGDEYSNKLRSALLQPNPIRWIRHKEEELKQSKDATWHQKQEAIRKWMSNAVEAATGMPAVEASDYVFSASRRSDSENIDIIDIISKINSFGVDRIRHLAAFSGIHGLEAYTTEQLERMEALAANPTEVAERLAQHDVTVVMINRFGDHRSKS